MPIFGENQVRQMYVLDSTHTAALKNVAKRHYFEYNGPDGKGGVEPICTDKIQKGHIKDVRISKLAAPALKEWLIATAGNPTAGVDYIVYLHLKNWIGFGETDRYEKFAAVHATTGMTQAQFYSALKSNLDLQFAREAYKPFEFVLPMSLTVTNKFKAVSPVYDTLVIAYDNAAAADAVTVNNSTITVTFAVASGKTVADLQTALAGYDITITPAGTATTATTVAALSSSNTLNVSEGVAIREKADPITKNDIVMGRFRLPIEMEITTNNVSGATWATNATNGVIKGTDYKAVKNGGIVAAMEYFFLRGRADRYGLNGCAALANPSEFVADPTADYYILDIKYFLTDTGVHSYHSEKEMTFACTDKSTLENLVYNSGSGIISSTTGTTLSGGRDCEIYEVA